MLMAYTEQNRKWCLGQKWRAAKWEDLTYTFGEGALVRYVDNPPLVDMEGIVEYLLSADGAANLTAGGKTVHGTYRTAAAWWEDVTVRGETRVRLYHECVPAAATGADTAYVTENGCMWAVTLTPYFRQAAVAVPTAGASGISYRVTQERRDPRTGLWMFVIERRDQKVTTTGVYTELDDKFKTVTGQAFYGVRTDDKDETGAAVLLWTPGNPEAGTLIENVSVQKNENCTRDIRQRKTVDKTNVTKVVGAKVTPWGSVGTTVVANATAAASLDAGQSGSVKNEDLANGLKETEKTVFTPAAAVAETGVELEDTKGGDFFKNSTRLAKVVAAKAEPAEDTGLQSDGSLLKVTYTKDDLNVLKKTTETETPTAGESFTLLDKSVTDMSGSILNTIVVEHTKIMLFKNQALTVPQAAADAFVASHVPFQLSNGQYWFWFYYSHDVGFSLHVNEHGLWEGTLTMRAVVTLGTKYTATS
jgi:hypothetical protein